jgi:hypothetical protein
MARWDIAAAVVFGLFSSMALSQGADGSAPADQRKRLIEQKLRLLESLVNSRAAQPSPAGREAEADERMLNGRKMLDRVREALASNQLDQASATLDEALRSATKVSARPSNVMGVLGAEVEQSSYQNLSEQVASYLLGIDNLAKQGSSEAKSVAARINVLQNDAGKLANSGKLGDANRKLADAYKLAVESISKLRAGQTVTLSLKFDTPIEEYDYERRRYQSSEILVNMMIGEGRADENRRNILPGFDNVTGEGLPEGGRRAMVDGLVREGALQLGLAAERAQGGDHKGAVALMEKATAKLNRALQVMGVQIF